MAKGPREHTGRTVVEQGLAAFGWLNYLTVGIYFAAMLWVGAWAGRRAVTTASYFTGGGQMNSIVVGLSLLATYLSAITMMALPALAFGNANLQFSIQLPFLLLTAVVITRWVLPLYRAAGVVSVYEYLEQQIDVSVRLLCSASFVLFSIARMGLVLYLPALAISTVTDLSLPFAILLMGLVVVFYTATGGFEAVIWTDAAMVVVFVAAALGSIGLIFYREGASFFPIAMEHNKFEVLVPGANLYEVTSLWLILETIFSTIRIFGTQQDMTQRYVATKSTAEANRSVWISILAYIPLGYVFYLMGTALFVWYTAHPDAGVQWLLDNKKTDALYPYFVVTQLPQGLSGLVIAGIFAAAMSSISSLMNSSSTVCVEDFLKRFSRRPRTDRDYLRAARGLTWFWGLGTIVMAFALQQIESAQIAWQTIMGVATNGVLGVMMLAFLPIRIHKIPAVTGFVLSYFVLIWMKYGAAQPMVWLLYTVLGNLSCFFIALVVQIPFGFVRKSPPPAPAVPEDAVDAGSPTVGTIAPTDE